MAQFRLSATIYAAGLQITDARTLEADGIIGHEIPVPAGKAGSLTTRTDANTGVATLASGHGITDADKVDVYWDDGVRYGMAVTAYDTTTVTVDGGAGDDLPAEATALVVSVQVEVDSDWDGDDLVALAIGCDQRAHCDFQDSGDASLLAVEVPQAGGWSWLSGAGTDSPITGNPVDKILVSNGSATAATLKIGGVRDSTP